MPSFALGKELSGLKGLLGRAGYGAGMFGLFNQGQSSSATSAAINRAAQIVPGLSPNPRTDLGRQFGNELQYIGGQLMQGRNPYAKPAVGNIPPSANGESYRRAELRLADAARPGGGGGGGGNAGYSTPSSSFASPAAERAYQQEASSVAQQAAQNPELQRYEQQRAAAAASGDQAQMNAARDIGMQMWAKANPGLAAKVKPGQSGYEAIQGGMAGEAARSGFGYQMPQQIMMTPPPGVNVPQGLPAVQSIGAAETFGQQGLQLDPEMIKKFQGLLNQAKP